MTDDRQQINETDIIWEKLGVRCAEVAAEGKAALTLKHAGFAAMFWMLVPMIVLLLPGRDS